MLMTVSGRHLAGLKAVTENSQTCGKQTESDNGLLL